MIRAVRAPALRHSRYMWLLWAYAAVLVALSVLQLVMFETTVLHTARLIGTEDTNIASITAIAVIAVQIFSLPYVLRLNTSRLAYWMSRRFMLLTPLLWATAGVYALLTVTDVALGFRTLLVSVVLTLLAAGTHWVVGVAKR